MPTAQIPISSGFNFTSTASDVLKHADLSGKIAIITGGSSGIGRVTAVKLREAGARVIVQARDVERARIALAGIDVEIEAMDLLDPHSIDVFAERFLSSGDPLHLLINSAGIMANPLARDERGYESQFATNHLGHFQLTRRLWPALTMAKGARVISVASWGHQLSPVDFEDPNYERKNYHPWLAYGQSKTANILFAVALDKKGKEHGVRAFSLHPGNVPGTGLQKHVSIEEQFAAGVVDEHGNPVHDQAKDTKTVEQGAATSLWCATSKQLAGMGGVYCEDCEIAALCDAGVAFDLSESNRQTGVLSYAIDAENAERLWAISEALL